MPLWRITRHSSLTVAWICVSWLLMNAHGRMRSLFLFLLLCSNSYLYVILHGMTAVQMIVKLWLVEQISNSFPTAVNSKQIFAYIHPHWLMDVWTWDQWQCLSGMENKGKLLITCVSFLRGSLVLKAWQYHLLHWRYICFHLSCNRELVVIKLTAVD